MDPMLVPNHLESPHNVNFPGTRATQQAIGSKSPMRILAKSSLVPYGTSLKRTGLRRGRPYVAYWWPEGDKRDLVSQALD